MRSLKSRLSLLMLAGTAALLLVAAVVLKLAVGTWMEREFDEALLAKAHALVTLTKQKAGVVELDFADEFMPEFERQGKPEYFQLWLLEGRVLERSRSLVSSDLSRQPNLGPAPSFTAVLLPDGRAGRQVQIDFVPQIKNGESHDADLPTNPRRLKPGSGLRSATLVVAKGREDLDSLLRQLSTALAALVASLLAAIAVLVPISVRIGLKPLEQVSEQVEALDADSLGSRFTVDSPPAELLPVIDRLNALLERLQAAFDRERLLSSNLAHELRTPIAELRNLSEVASRWPEDTQAVQRYFRDVHDISLQMDRVVSHLLALARSESGNEPVELSRFKLADVVEAVWLQLSLEARQREIEIRKDIPSDLFVETDRTKLELILSNLLANAIAYSPVGGSVAFFAERRLHPEVVTLKIANRAEDLAAADLPFLSDRFWRKDAARTGGQHTGLGLSLVRALAKLLDIQLDLDLSPTQVFTVTLVLPAPSPRSLKG